MLYMFQTSYDLPEYLIGEYDEDKSVDRFLFIAGNYIKEPSEKIIVRFDCKLSEIQQFDNLKNTSGLPLVNRKFRETLLQHCPNDVQFFDCVVKCVDGVSHDYQIVNVTHCIPAIDMEQSVYKVHTVDSSSYQLFSHYCLKTDECMGNHHMIRPVNYPVIILISHQLYRYFKLNGLKGVEPITMEEYNSYLRG